MPYTIQPLHEQIYGKLVSSLKPEAGLIVPDSAESNQAYLLVLAVGDKCTRVAPGDKIYFHHANFYPFDAHQKTGFIPESLVLGKLVEETLPLELGSN